MPLNTQKRIEDALDLKLFVASMGRVFRITAIAKSTEEANEICDRNNHWGVIAEDSGLIFIAELYGPKLTSDIIKKLYD